MRGKFLVVEGVDGSGKTTQAVKIVSYLMSKKLHVLATKEPTDLSSESNKIRKILKESGKVTDSKEVLAKLFVKDRKYHFKKIIKPALEMGINVVSDRYDISTLAYQHTQGVPLDYLMKLHKGLPEPDLTLIIDVDSEVVERRLKEAKRDAVEIFEKDSEREFRRNLINNYRKIAKILRARGRKIKIVNGNREVEDVFADVKRYVDEIIK